MHTRGVFAPGSAVEAKERYDDLAPVARTVVSEAAKGMAFDREEYDERITPEVVARVHDALFASLLEVQVGTREEFDAWAEAHEDDGGSAGEGGSEDDGESEGEVVVVGSDAVDRVAWHAPPFADAVAATFQDEEDAAVDALRRQAFGRIYRERLREEA